MNNAALFFAILIGHDAVMTEEMIMSVKELQSSDEREQSELARLSPSQLAEAEAGMLRREVFALMCAEIRACWTDVARLREELAAKDKELEKAGAEAATYRRELRILLAMGLVGGRRDIINDLLASQNVGQVFLDRLAELAEVNQLRRSQIRALEDERDAAHADSVALASQLREARDCLVMHHDSRLMRVWGDCPVCNRPGTWPNNIFTRIEESLKPNPGAPILARLAKAESVIEAAKQYLAACERELTATKEQMDIDADVMSAAIGDTYDGMRAAVKQWEEAR